MLMLAARRIQSGIQEGRAGDGRWCRWRRGSRSAVVDESDAAGLAVPAILQQVEGGWEEALEGVDLELQDRSLVDVARPVDAHVAACPRASSGW